MGSLIFQPQEFACCSVVVQMVNILDFAGHVVSVTTSHFRVKAAVRK